MNRWVNVHDLDPGMSWSYFQMAITQEPSLRSRRNQDHMNCWADKIVLSFDFFKVDFAPPFLHPLHQDYGPGERLASSSLLLLADVFSTPLSFVISEDLSHEISLYSRGNVTCLQDRAIKGPLRADFTSFRACNTYIKLTKCKPVIILRFPYL